MMARGPRLPWMALAAMALFAAPARADEAAAAKALFDSGLEEMKRERYESACPMIAESFQRNPLPGALFTLAECEAKRGRVSTAYKRYEEYLAVFAALPRDKQAKQHGRDKHSREQMAALSPKVPKIKLGLPPGEATVTLDGQKLQKVSDGAVILVDPGEHVITVDAPPAPQAEQRFTIALSEEKSITFDVNHAPRETPDTVSPAPPSGLRIASYAVGGTGLALLTVGAVTGGLALGKKGAIEAGCQLDDRHGIALCNAEGLAAGQSVKTLGTASTITFIGGLAAVGVGVGLFVASMGSGSSKKPDSGRRARPTVIAGPRGAMIGAEGAW